MCVKIIRGNHQTNDLCFSYCPLGLLRFTLTFVKMEIIDDNMSVLYTWVYDYEN